MALEAIIPRIINITGKIKRQSVVPNALGGSNDPRGNLELLFFSLIKLLVNDVLLPTVRTGVLELFEIVTAES